MGQNRQKIFIDLISSLNKIGETLRSMAGSEKMSEMANRWPNKLEKVNALKSKSFSNSSKIDDGALLELDDGTILFVVDLKIPEIVGLPKLPVELVTLNWCQSNHLSKREDTVKHYVGRPGEGSHIRRKIISIF